MSLVPGTRIGPYEIAAAVGAGGMGEVYRAHDTRLGRDVAVKVLPAVFSRDDDRMRRFEAEARAVAALNHPNILSVHDVGTTESTSYLVCELLEGESLRERLKDGPIPPRKAVEYARQISDGLAAAHEKGITHRDLKPENIFIVRDGRIKILDFGLAKLERIEPAAALSMTLPGAPQTSAGTVMGTTGYMSPEQVRGEPVDSRSDIFSFGAVLYEMLTGTRAFRGDSAVETMNAILRADVPDMDLERLNVSPALDRIVRHCLEKNRAERFQSVRDLSFALGSISDTTSASRAVAATTARSGGIYAAAGLAVVLAAFAAYWFWPVKAAARPMYFGMTVRSEISGFAISPNGRMLAFVSPDDTSGQNMLYVQDIGGRTSRALPGTAGAQQPFWSPDARYVAFFKNSKLMKMPLDGSAPETIVGVSAEPRGGSWGSKNVIIYAGAATAPLYRVNSDGSDARPLTKMGTGENAESSHRWPAFLPDGEHYVFLAWAPRPAIYVGSLETPDRHKVVNSVAGAEYAGGYLLFLDDSRDLVMQRLDPDSGALSGDRRSLGLHPKYNGVVWRGAFSAAQEGTVIANPNRGFALSRLTWVDRAGVGGPTVGDVGMLYNPALSSDGRRLTFDLNDLQTANTDIYVAETAGLAPRRFTFDPSEEVNPIFSPDARSVVFRRYAPTGNRLVLKPLSGIQPERVIASPNPEARDIAPDSWTPDSKSLLVDLRNQGAVDVWLVDVAAATRTKFLATPANERDAHISPDGKWVAYSSDESGQYEVYVTSFPGAVGKWQVSSAGGTQPRWRADGKELFFVDSKGILTAAGISTSDDGIAVASVTPLFPLLARAPVSATDLAAYAPSPDGSRFLVNRVVKTDRMEPLEVVLNAAGIGG